MDRHRLKQLRDKVGELHRFGSPSCMREASSIMRDEFDSVLSFALDATKPEPKPKHTIADHYPAGGLTATEPCMYCEDYAKIEQQRDDLFQVCKTLVSAGKNYSNTNETITKFGQKILGIIIPTADAAIANCQT